MTAQLYNALGPVVADLTPSRGRLADLYNDWLAGAGRSTPVNFAHAVVSAADALADQRPLPARPAGALQLALAALASKDEAHACFAAMVGGGLFDHQFALAPEGAGDAAPVTRWRQALLGRALDALKVGDLLPRLELQHAQNEAMVRHDDYWHDPGTLLPAILHGRRRLCIIEAFDDAGGVAQGSGFLVGPSAVLTNWHVVEKLPTHLADPSQLQIRFDFSDTTAKAQLGNPLVLPSEDWCLAKGELADPGPSGPDYWWDEATARADWLGIVNDQLDFAIIRLAEVPGLRRGWYKLSTTRRRRPVGTWALHHPAGGEHTLTNGGIAYPAQVEKRIFHTASTVKGSSGGLILDQDGAALGLHYAALTADTPPDPMRPDQKHQVLNVAMGLRQIALRLQSEGLLDAVETPSQLRPPRGVLADNRPVFGRTSFFEALTELWRPGGPSILRVDIMGEPEALHSGGKSYSEQMLRAVFHGSEHHHILLRAGDIKVDAAQVAETVLQSFAADLVAAMPQAQDTTTPAHVRALVSFLNRAIEERLSDKSVWITLDDLDKHSLADASGREFLATLYDEAPHIRNLRIVLIGLPAGLTISGIDPEAEQVTLLSQVDADLLREDFVAWMQEHARGLAEIADEGYDILGALAASVSAGEAPLVAMSDFADKHVGPLLRARTKP